jgi:hypothetical protein
MKFLRVFYFREFRSNSELYATLIHFPLKGETLPKVQLFLLYMLECSNLVQRRTLVKIGKKITKNIFLQRHLVAHTGHGLVSQSLHRIAELTI